MKEKNIIIKTIQLLTIIPLYYIVGDKSIFIYVLSLSLYNIFASCFTHLSFKESFNKLKESYHKLKLLNLASLTIGVISIIFLLFSIIVSDISSSILKIDNLFLVFLVMGISIVTEPLLNLLIDYLESTKRKRKSIILYNIYHISESILLLIISILLFRIIKTPIHINIALMYLSKIISFFIVLVFIYPVIKKDVKPSNNKVQLVKYNYRLELKKILTNNHYKSIINIVKNSYYYISIIILYLILSTRYFYATSVIELDLTFIYFYFLNIINYLIDIINFLVNKNIDKSDISSYMYITTKIILPIIITLSIISPLSCKLLFNTEEQSIYLVMLNFMSIFIALYNITSNNIKNKKILCISLFSGLFIKIITTIPLINAFYRMGYNLVYGDVISTIISLLITIIINYMASSNKVHKGQNYLDKILNTLYENILLAIILIIIEFIIPIKTDSYLKSLFLIIVYLSVSIVFIKVKNKYKE